MSATLSKQAFDTLVAHAERSRPRECCGLLLGRGDPSAGGHVELTEAVPAGNLADDPDRFLLDPVDHIRTRREARARGLDVVGFYHSHPHSAARPSARDVAEALASDAVHLIVSLEARAPVALAYAFAGGRFVEVPLQVGLAEDPA